MKPELISPEIMEIGRVKGTGRIHPGYSGQEEWAHLRTDQRHGKGCQSLPEREYGPRQ